jgi:transcriptional regulator with GAF, ATPase, and Fis domain
LSYVKLREENSSLKGQIKGKAESGKMIGYSDQMKKIFQTIEKVSSSDSTIIIYGESGTGKELVARSIHFNSDRRDQPLIPVNCGAIPEHWKDCSDMKGPLRCDPLQDRTFELAQGGRSFDEIGRAPLQVNPQGIQEKQFGVLGAQDNPNVRIITATHQNLEQAVADRWEDLLSNQLIPVRLPPARTGMDIIILANHFLAHFNETRKQVQRITPQPCHSSGSINKVMCRLENLGVGCHEGSRRNRCG